ncbi:hypothetical protein DICPUDRAFT_32083 [Dictyostelium purpureum]|uniref:Ubiquitin-like protease family profile domain-containing protein n=1 Tax=Dictyostelium purpureum TaxID=5786 RepID=F0ZID8_DICPU|nr:uncharacterized protein DICPUDRAFT_32083 [Dictyostelium purpureum]EGC36291.1 hypothetical protein DICPUDRAFT_32083 [Dictyostelium purpureum]|eukprot:XP_003287169.1 hypothetical protein DICPUDRAFT_32083 [Dictyostelium purpureum]
MDLKRGRGLSTRLNAEQRFKQQRSEISNIDVSNVNSCKFVGTGTFDCPVNLDDDDDFSAQPNSDKKNILEDDDINEIQEVSNAPIIVDPDNIFLTPGQIKIGQYDQHPTDQIVFFKENQIEITIPFYFLSPNTTLVKKEHMVIIEIPYKNIKEFVVSCFNKFINIDILLNEFSYKKLWLTKITALKNFEYGISNSISFFVIPRDQFEAMKPFIEKKSSNLRLSMEIEDHSKMDKVIALYPHIKSTKEFVNNRDIVKITYSDKSRLEPSQYLNDSIIDFYIRYIKDHYVLDIDKTKFYFFSTFFYNIIGSHSNSNTAYTRISKWTKNVDIFSFDFLFIPICLNSHWTLLIISFPCQEFETATETNKPLIIFLDSLNSQSLLVITKKIREYLTIEWKHKKSDPSNGTIPERVFTSKNLPLVRANVPKQDNLFDCGVFLLHYIELFCRNPETNFNDPLNRPHWFTCEEITTKREKIKNIIETLEEEQKDDFTPSKKSTATQEKESNNNEKDVEIEKDIEMDDGLEKEDKKENQKEDRAENDIINGNNSILHQNEIKQQEEIKKDDIKQDKIKEETAQDENKQVEQQNDIKQDQVKEDTIQDENKQVEQQNENNQTKQNE